MHRATVVAGLVIGVSIAGATQAPPPPRSLDECDARVRTRPRDLDSYRCYDLYAQDTHDHRGALARLEEIVARDPDMTHARLFLARMLDLRDPGRADRLLDEAVDEYREAGDRVSEAWARAFRLRQLVVQQRFEDARVEADSARSLAQSLGDHKLAALVAVEQARMHVLESDEARAWGVLRQVELGESFSDLSPAFQCGVFDLLATVSGSIELEGIALSYARRMSELADTHGLKFWRAQAAKRIAEAATSLADRGRMERADARRLVLEALELTDNPIIALPLRRHLARLSDGEEALALLSDLAIAAEGEPFFAYLVHVDLGVKLFEVHPERPAEAFGHLEQALAAARQTRQPRPVATVLAALGRLRLRAGPRDESVGIALSAMDAIERMHDLQTGEQVGALVFASYAPIYYQLVDTVLASAPQDLTLAFATSERLRSRSLLDHLRSVAPGEDHTLAAARRRQEVLRELSELQLERILGRDPSAARIERLEAEEAVLRDESLRSDPAHAVPAGRDLASLDDVRRTLASNEAFLSFLLAPEGVPGSWVLASTSEGTRAYRLPERAVIETAARFWLGLLQGSDGGDEIGAARLYGDLLGQALAGLPAGITRLIIAPDGPLHRFPFDALRPSPRAAPLLESYEIVLVPSATVWLRLREERRAAASTGALFLADPETRLVASEPAGPVGRLPYARIEARRALRALRARDELRTGSEASERYLKHADLRRYRLVHLATHALLDEADPARSAILLAGGDDGEDGLLQAREVVDLDLTGTLVTLSACRSAGGTVLTGEGVLGLARSFFQARAAAVVGGLWPVHDRATAELMSAFYRRLAAGDEVSTALAGAKRERRQAGAPPSVWAGMVVLGDGTLAPWPAAADPVRDTSPLWAIALIAAVVLAAVPALGLGLRRLRRSV